MIATSYISLLQVGVDDFYVLYCFFSRRVLMLGMELLSLL